MDYSLIYPFVFLFVNLTGVLADRCRKIGLFLQPSYFYCPYTCCGPIDNEYCCARSSRLTIGGTAGIVVGCFVFLAIFTLLGLACKKKGYYGRVFRPNMVRPNGMTTVQVTHTAMPGQQRYRHPVTAYPPGNFQNTTIMATVPPPVDYMAPPPQYDMVAPPPYNQIQQYPYAYQVGPKY